MENITSKVLCGVGATLLLAGCGGDSKPNIAIGPPCQYHSRRFPTTF